MRNAVPRIVLFGPLSVCLSLAFSHFIFFAVVRGYSFSFPTSLFFVPSFSRSLLPPSLLLPLRLSARGSFQLVPAETFHRPRPPFSAFFPSGFFSPPRTFLACLISGLFFSGRKSRVKIAEPCALNTAARAINIGITCAILSRESGREREKKRDHVAL